MDIDDDDDFLFDDAMLTQIEKIESEAGIKPEPEVDQLKKTVEDYKRQIECLQDKEITLHGESSMLRQKLETIEKLLANSKLDSRKELDNVTTAHKRRIDELEGQIKNLKSQLQFAEHEVQQARSSRPNFDNSLILSPTRQTPKSAVQKWQSGPNPFTPEVNRVPGKTAQLGVGDENVNPALNLKNSLMMQADNEDRKWFLPSRFGHLQHVCGGYFEVPKNISVVCPVSKRVFVCDVTSTASIKSIGRSLDHIKVMLNRGNLSSDFIDMLKLVAKFISLQDESFHSKHSSAMDDDKLLAIITLLEETCDFLEDAAVSKQIVSHRNLQSAALRLVACMFLRLPFNRSGPALDVNPSELYKRYCSFLRRLFERVLPSFLLNSVLDRMYESCGLTASSQVALPRSQQPSVVGSLNQCFESAILVLSSAASHFNVIDLKSFLADCPLFTVGQAFHLWFNDLPMDYQITSNTRAVCFNLLQLLTRTLTLNGNSMERFFNHPCHCQTLVIGVLSQIGRIAMKIAKPTVAGEISGNNSPLVDNDLLNPIVLDAVLNIFVLLESHQTLKSSNQEPEFYNFLAKLSEFLCYSESNPPCAKLRPSTVTNMKTLLRYHDLLN